MRRLRLPAVVVATLITIASLPVVGTACALVCEPAQHAGASSSDGSMHHGQGACHAKDTGTSRIAARSTHDCGTHVAVRTGAATPVTARPDLVDAPASSHRAPATLLTAAPGPAFHSPAHGPPLPPSGAVSALVALRV